MFTISVFYKALVVLLFALVCRADHENEYVFPGASGPSNNFAANLVLPLGSTQTIQLRSNSSSSLRVMLYQQLVEKEEGVEIKDVCMFSSSVVATNPTLSCSWNVQLYTSKLSDSPIFFLWTNPGSPDGFSSHYFNISAPSASDATASPVAVPMTTASPLTTSASPSTSTTSSSSTKMTSSTFLTSSTPTPGTSPGSTGAAAVLTSPSTTASANKSTTSSDNNPVTLSVGLGVGLGIGIPLVLIAGILVGLHAVKHRKVNAGQQIDESGKTFAVDGSQRTQGQDDNFHDFQPAPQYQRHPPGVYEANAAEIYEAAGNDRDYRTHGPVEAPTKNPIIRELE